MTPSTRCSSKHPCFTDPEPVILRRNPFSTVLTAYLFTVLGAVVMLSACGSTRSWTYNTPPTALSAADPPADARSRAHLPLIAIAPFDNPQRATVNWRSVGRGMSDALARAIINHGRFDVRHDAALGKRIDTILAGDPERQGEQLRALADEENEHDDGNRLRYAILGRVTDFHHTSELPREMTRIGGRNEAITAVELRIVDLQRGRVVISDHVYGTSPAGKASPRDLYDKVAFGSYLFWSTPLGRASEVALNRAMDRVQQGTDEPRYTSPYTDSAAAPASLTATPPSITGHDLRIIRQLDDREIEIRTPPDTRLAVGREYYLCRRVDQKPVAIIDPATRQPVRARIISSSTGEARALLLGLPPAGHALPGAMLRANLPPTIQ